MRVARSRITMGIAALGFIAASALNTATVEASETHPKTRGIQQLNADCVINAYPNYVIPEVHVRCATTGPYKAIAICSRDGSSTAWYESAWTQAGSWAQVECPVRWKLVDWGKVGGGSSG